MAGFLLLGVLLVVLFSTFVPYNMDEFIHFNTLQCIFFPFRDTIDSYCHGQDLNFADTGIILPLRAYDYIGSFPALYYLPLYLLWPSPLSSRFLGYLFLLGGAVVLSRTYRFRLTATLASLLLFFPYTFQHFSDTGPVGFQILTVYLVYVLIGRWLRTLHWRYPVIVAVLIFLGIWTKLSYFWLLPAYCVFLLLHAVSNRTFLLKPHHIAKFVRQILLMTGICGSLLAPLLLSTDAGAGNTYPYLRVLQNSTSYSLGEMIRGIWLHSGIVKVLTNPLETTQRIFVVMKPESIAVLWTTILFLLVPLTITGILVGQLTSERKHLVRSAVLYGCFLLTLAMIMRTKASYAMHHAVLAFPFLILAVCECLAALRKVNWRTIRKERMFPHLLIGVCSVFAGLNIYYWTVFPFQQVKSESDASRQVLHEVLSDKDIASAYVIYTVDWGMYFYQGLYGDRNQIVTFWRTGSKDLRQLRQSNENGDRKALFVFNARKPETEMTFLRTSLSLKRCDAVPASATWQIFAEPDPILQTACRRRPPAPNLGVLKTIREIF